MTQGQQTERQLGRQIGQQHGQQGRHQPLLGRTIATACRLTAVGKEEAVIDADAEHQTQCQQAEQGKGHATETQGSRGQRQGYAVAQ